MTQKNGTETVVTTIPNCDFCARDGKEAKAFADCSVPAIGGSWASVCYKHFIESGARLGLGAGQKYVLRTEPEKSQDERIKENMRGIDWDTMTLDDFEEIFEDRDPFEFM